MSEREKKFHWVPHLIRHDFWRKFFALGFALLVTATVYSDKRKNEDETFVIHNVQPTLGLESGYVWRTRNLQQVSLTIRGPRAKLFDLKPEDFTLDYMIGEKEYRSKNKNGRQFVTLQAKDVRCRHPRGALLQVLEIAPAEYTFTIDKIVKKEVPVKAEYRQSDLPKGYAVAEIRFPDRKTVFATGPERLLEGNIAINTEPIPLKNHVADFTTNVRLRPIEGLLYDTDQIMVSVKMKKNMKTVVRNLEVYMVLPPEKWERYTIPAFGFPPVDVIVSGEEDAVAALKPGDLLVYLDFNDFTGAGTYKDVPLRCSVRHSASSGITSITCSPRIIPEITVRERPAAQTAQPEPKPEVKKEDGKKADEPKPEVKKKDAKKS